MTAVPLPEPRHVETIRAAHLPATEGITPLLWVVIYGPGIGESIVVRLPDGRVGVIDGCREPGGNSGDGDENPVANLLRELNPPRLLFACLTHPHADHYPGLGHLLERDFSQRVDHVWNVLSLTLREKNAVLRWIKRHYEQEPDDPLPDAEQLRRLDRAMTALLQATRRDSTPARRQQLLAGRILLRDEVCSHRFEIEAWGPSDEDIDDALFEFLYAETEDKKHGKIDPNSVSGALLLRWKQARFLLAGDLITHESGHRGWGPARGLLARHRHVQAVNVAHHASAEAHDKALWEDMKPRLAIVTPFRNAETQDNGTPHHPPKPDDIRRLCASGCEVIITAEPAWHRTPKGLSVPKRLNAGRPPPAKPQKSIVISSKLKASIASPPDARDNAAAIALAPNGDIVRVLLAGDADFYR